MVAGFGLTVPLPSPLPSESFGVAVVASLAPSLPEAGFAEGFSSGLAVACGAVPVVCGAE